MCLPHFILFPKSHTFHEASPYSLYYCSLFVVTTEVPSSSQPCPLGCFDLQPPTFRTFWKSSDFQVVVAEICKNLFHPLSWKKYKSKFCVVFVMQRIFQLDLIGWGLDRAGSRFVFLFCGISWRGQAGPMQGQKADVLYMRSLYQSWFQRHRENKRLAVTRSQSAWWKRKWIWQGLWRRNQL